jgi:subtilase family serine protease
MRKLVSILGLTGLVVSVSVSTANASAAGARAPRPLPAHANKHVCRQAGLRAACQARIVTRADGVTPLATTTYQYGFTPQNLASAYKWTDPSGSSWAWNGHTVAIVDAYDNPSAASDLAAYRSRFGLPPCTTANTCFRKVNQTGGSTPPSGDTGWGQEIDLDIEMASAVCPQCRILLVEASSNFFSDLGAAVNEAAKLGADAISNSYGTNGEFFGESSYDPYYTHSGVAVTASSGDSGYGVEYPAASPDVVAVGGTSLSVNTSTARGWSETAWSGAGSGCSAIEPKPAWQTDTGCSQRTVADVSAVADPNTGVAVFDSFGSIPDANWYVFGGTSVSSPIIASVFALKGNAAAIDFPARYLYANPSALFDVTSGSNGSCSRGGGKHHRTSGAPYLCTAGVGYDGPTGLGTPNGTTAF